MNKPLRLVVLVAAILAQAAVPAWMLIKHHLILTRGEKVVLPVTLGDPRDLFMGHYARLRVARKLPPLLQGIPNNYLRYYCDQRYAKRLDRLYDDYPGELTVRVWRGAALAETLTIGGMPAYAFIDQNAPAQAADERGDTLRLLAVDASSGFLNEDLEMAEWVAGMDFGRGEEGFVVPCTVEDWWRATQGALPGDPPMTPPEASARWRAAGDAIRRCDWDTPMVFPLFSQPPAGVGDVSSGRIEAYYATIRDWKWSFRTGQRLLFLGDAGAFPPRETLAALRKTLPEARWLLPATTLPEGLDPDAVVLLLDAPPAKDPGAPWLLRGRADPNRPLPKGCLGTLERIDALDAFAPPVPGEAARLIAQLRKMPGDSATEGFLQTCVLALIREANALGDRALLDRALLLDERCTLRARYERCPTYVAYRALVARLAHRESLGKRVLLGGWPAVRVAAGDPPPPPVATPQTPQAILALADALRIGSPRGE